MVDGANRLLFLEPGRQLAKLILLVVVFFVVYTILKTYQRNVQRREQDTVQTEGSEDMVRCAHCGVNLPKSESIFSRDKFYCTDEHRKLSQN
jgi:uncharacterized protein